MTQNRIIKKFRDCSETMVVLDPYNLMRSIIPMEKPKREDYMSYPHMSDYPDIRECQGSDMVDFYGYSGEDLTHAIEFLNRRQADGCPEMFSPMYFKEISAFRAARKAWADSLRSDWEKCGYGSHLENLGFSSERFLSFQQFYDGYFVIGYKKYGFMPYHVKYPAFKTRSGHVVILPLKDVKAYNPNFDIANVIDTLKDFRGYIAVEEVGRNVKEKDSLFW